MLFQVSFISNNGMQRTTLRAAANAGRQTSLKMDKVSDRALQGSVLLGMLNFVLFCGGALILGGDALNGHAAHGHFYLASHGQLTEVGRGVWTYSLLHALSNLITFPLMVGAGIVSWFRRLQRWSQGGRGTA